jgi:hypothetical protein
LKRLLRLALSLALTYAGTHSTAMATENGGGIYPNGAESFLTAEVPPPGYYLIDYVNYYEAQRLLGANGKDLAPNFRVDALANAVRYVHWGKQRFLGAQLGQQVVIPYVSLDVSVAGAHGHKSGFGDVTLDPLLLSYQNAKFHFVLTPEFNIPTGSYVKGDVANIGRNYYNFEPVLAFTYTGRKNFEFDTKLMYDINGTNTATNYKSGNEFHADYAIGYNNRGMFVGIAGYYYDQTSDDLVNGAKVGPDGFRGRVFSYGPDIHMSLAKGFLALKWEHEVNVRYRPQGDKFWLKLIQHVGND